MRDSDWSRQILLRSDWLHPSVALYTTSKVCRNTYNYLLLSTGNIMEIIAS